MYQASRRTLVLNTALSLVCIAAIPANASLVKNAVQARTGSGIDGTGDVLARMDEAFANSFVDSSFEFWNEHGRSSAVLRSVSNQKSGTTLAAAQNIRSFAMEFVVVESTQSMADGLCHVVHPKLGTFEMFVVPSVNSKSQRCLVATFSRI